MKKLSKKPIKKYANGGDPPTDDSKKGIKYVSDPNDPALKAYQDSLLIHNKTIEFGKYYKDVIDKEIGKGDMVSAYNKYYDAIDKMENINFKNSWNNLTNLNGTPPSPSNIIMNSYYPEKKDYGYFSANVYKKPVQPVKLAKTFGDIDPQTQKKMIEGRHGWMGDPKEATLKGPIKKGAQYPRFSLPSAIQGEGMRDIYEYNPKTGNYLPTSTMPLDDVKNMDIINKATTESMRKDIERFLPGSTKQKAKTFLTGGQVGSLAGAALSFIPGVGGLLNTGANMLGQLYDEQHKEDPTKIAGELKQLTENPYGNYKNGGKVPDNLKALDGGRFKKLSHDIFLAKGKSHKSGGIEGDIDNDGQPEIELEGNELYFDKEQYIVNKDISKKYINKFSKRPDKVAQNTNSMLKKMAIGENEKLLATKNYKNGGKLPKYINGSPIPDSFLDLLSQGRQDAFMQDPVKNSASKYDPLRDLTNPLSFEGSNISYAGLNEGSRANGIGTNEVTRIGEGGDSTVNTNTTTDKYKMTAGDAVNIAGQAVAPIYNLARGLFEKSKVEQPVFNPNASKIESLMSNRKYNDQTVQNELDYTREAGKTAITENSSSASVRRGNFQNLYSNIGRNKATADLQGQQMNNQFRAEEAQTLNSLGAQDVQAINTAKGINYQNAAAKDAYISTGVSQIGAGASTVAEGMNTQKQNGLLLNLLGNLSNIYTMDADGKITLKK